MKKLVIFLLILGTGLSLYAEELEFHDFPILSKYRLDLTREYSRRHYKLDTYFLHEPVMIIVHYTAVGSLGATLSTFKPATMSQEREKLYMFGKLNVGVHYVIDTNGEIYKLLPTSVMGRHAIGYNHLSIGIENVAISDSKLTRAQIRTNAKLIDALLTHYPSIKYLIGHHEYMNRRLPHFKLYTQTEMEYEPTVKIDPGFQFMDSLRDILKNEYHIVLLQ